MDMLGQALVGFLVLTTAAGTVLTVGWLLAGGLGVMLGVVALAIALFATARQ